MDNSQNNPNPTNDVTSDDAANTAASTTAETTGTDSASTETAANETASTETAAPEHVVTSVPAADSAPAVESPIEPAPSVEATTGGNNAPAGNSASTSNSAPGETAAAGNTGEAGGRTRQPSMAQVMESDEFSNYMSGAGSLARGALLKGIVVRVDGSKGEVLVDIGTKSEGIIARNEMGEDEVNVGDEIEVVVLRSEDDEGHPILSKRRADYERLWREMAVAKQNNTTLEGTVREQVKGGLIVDLGVSAFVPASQVDTRHRGDLARFVGRTIPVRVIEIDRKKNKVIASHRQASEEDRLKREAEAWGNLQKDKIVEGVVRRITDFGAFIDLGGIDGLLHVREMAWGRVDHPENIVKKGQKLQVLILDIDEERKRIALGLKQLQSDPWKKAAKNYRVGQMINGKVVRIAPSCAFMELEDGVEGIIPIAEMSEGRIGKPEDVLEVGQELEARIKQIQPNQRRITLSLRAAVVERERRETRTALREVNERAGGDDQVRLGDVFGQQLRAARDRGRERNEAKAAARSQARERALQAADEEEEDWGDDVEDTTETAGAVDVEEETVDEAPTVEPASDNQDEDQAS